MWALVQRAVHEAGFTIEAVSVLDKGQRSVKGLSSGFENVVTFDLILSMRKAGVGEQPSFATPGADEFERVVDKVLASEQAVAPSHVYVGVIRNYLERHLDLTEVDMEHVAVALDRRGYGVESVTGRLIAPAGKPAPR